MYELPKTANPTRPSVAFVTMHKAGSSIADRIFRVYIERLGLTYVNLAEASRRFDVTEAEFCCQHADKLSAPGYYFGPFRGVYAGDMGGFRSNRLIVQIRDPRDCICSHYYSMGWSHRVPIQGKRKDEFLKRRDEIRSQEIDQYAVANTGGYLRRLEVIQTIIDSHSDARLLTYEDMVERTPAWRDQVETFLGVKRDRAMDEALVGLLDFHVDAEDPQRHKRQVSPGDHRRKLSPETIAEMNKTLGPVLERFDYPR